MVTILTSTSWHILLLQLLQGVSCCWWWYLRLCQISHNKYLRTNYVWTIYWEFIACFKVKDKMLHTIDQLRILVLIRLCGRRPLYCINGQVVGIFRFPGEFYRDTYGTRLTGLIIKKWSFGVSMVLHVSKSIQSIYVQLNISDSILIQGWLW